MTIVESWKCVSSACLNNLQHVCLDHIKQHLSLKKKKKEPHKLYLHTFIGLTERQTKLHRSTDMLTDFYHLGQLLQRYVFAIVE